MKRTGSSSRRAREDGGGQTAREAATARVARSGDVSAADMVASMPPGERGGRRLVTK